MKVFFFYIGTPTPVLETELELIRNHERAGDVVRVMQCSGHLANCHWNQKHSAAQCSACRSKFRNGWEVLAPGQNVELLQFPPNDLSGVTLPDRFESVEDIKRFRHDGENLGYGVASGLISLLRDHRFDPRRHHADVMRELRTCIQVYEALKSEFLSFSPDRVYFFNGRIATHLPAYLLCRKLGIEHFSYEVAGRNNSYRLMRNKRVHEPISHAEIEAMRATCTAQDCRASEAVVRGRRLGRHSAKIPLFTTEQVKGLLPAGFDAGRRNIAIFNSTIDEYAGVEGWGGTLYTPDETSGVARILESFQSNPAFMFYLRVHPSMKELPRSTSQLVDIAALAARYRNLHVVWPEENVHTYTLMEACEKVITFGSTIGIEAAYWGKPSILAGRSMYENFDCIHKPSSHEEMVAMLRADLPALPAQSSLLYFHWEISDGTPFEYFQETGVRHGLATGTFDGVEIRPDRIPKLRHEIARLLRGAAGAARRPGQAWAMWKRYAKTIR